MKLHKFILPLLLVLFIFSCVSAPYNNQLTKTTGNLPWELSPFEASYAEMSAAADELEMEGEHGVRVLLSEGHFTFAEDGSLTESYKWVYKILDQSGIDGWSSTKVNWTPWNQEKPTIRVRVTNPDGNSYFLAEESIMESTESSSIANIYSDQKLLQAPFPKVTIGSIVEELTSIVTKEPKFDTGISRSWFFEGSNPLAMNRVVINVPNNLSFHYKLSLKKDLLPQVSESENIRTYIYEYPLVPVAEENEYGLPLDHPHWVSLGFSTGESWQKLAGVYSELVEGKLDSTDFSLELTDLKAETAHETAVNITQWLNTEIRYTGLELGTGSIIPTTPEITLERGFGDCKDKAVIVTAMMREAGFEAWVGLLRSGTSTDIDPSLPSLSGFNHAIVYIGGDNPFWIDPTSEFSYNGYFPLSNQNRWALIASDSTKDLVKTQHSVPEDNKTIREIEYFLSDDGFADVEEKTTYYGGEDSTYRSRYAFAKEDDISTALDDYIQRAYRFGEKTDFKYSDPGNFDTNFNVTVSIKGAGRGVTEESQAIVAIMQNEMMNYLPDLFSWEPSIDENEERDIRENDYYFYKPFTFETRYTINPPVGFSLRELPESEFVDLGVAGLTKDYKQLGNTVEAVFILKSGVGSISPEDFESTREKVIKYAKSNPVLLVFDHIGVKLLSDGDYRGSIDYMKAISDREPGKEIHLIRLADALLKAGLGLDAQKAAEKAVAVNGESSKAYSKLAWILQHDELGRRLRPGYNRSSAIDAYRKAIELDKDEWSNFANLAILLEYDENGLRYSSGDLREAVETYKEIGDKLNEHGMDINLITDLLYLQDWEELGSSLEKIDNQKTVSLYKIVTYGAENNFDAAFSEAAKTGDAVDRRKILTNAGELLIHIRRYAAAAAFLEEASKGSSDAMSLELRADTLSRTLHFEDIKMDNDNPVDLVKRFYKALYMSGGTNFSELKDIVSSDIFLRAMDNNYNNNFHSEWLAIMNRGISSGLKLEVILDLILSDLKFQIKEDNAGGYHLKLIQTGLGTNLNSNFYIKKIDGSLKIVGTDSFRESIGSVIMENIKSGGIENSAMWLDWFLKDYGQFTRVGDEPLYGHPIHGFWKKRGNDLSNVELLKIAAASILVTEKSLSGSASAILTNGLKSNSRLDGEIYYALYFAYESTDNFEGQLETSSWLYKNFPESEFAWSALLNSLLNLGKYDELKDLAEERLTEDDEDSVAIDMLINMYFTKMDFDSVDIIFQDLKDKNLLTARLYNAVAWMDLFDPELDETALEYARQAVTLSNSNNPPILHTLSALYAEFGRCEEARNTLDRVMALSGSTDPSSDDWYVLGRIAEEYGMLDSAKFYYNKVDKPDSLASQYDSSYTLAARRLEIIGLK